MTESISQPGTPPVVNLAVPDPSSETRSKADAETVRRLILQKIPNTGLIPAKILDGLNQFDRGAFDIVKSFDVIRTRHHVTTGVVAKREKRVARMRWDVLIKADSAKGREAEAEKHKQALLDFYNGIEATDVLEADVRGGFGTLLRQMARAIGNRYAVHEITWKPATPSKPFTAEFRMWPLWSFEARDGKLRWLRNIGMSRGEEMMPGEWLVTVSEGLMRATVGIVAIQTMGLNDWANFAEKFGLPFVLGKTNAGKDTAEWTNMKALVKGFVGDGGAVVNLDAVIELITAGAAGTPHRELVEYCDRWITALWLGADLATMSAGSGQGQGASLQQRESETLEQDDARDFSEILNKGLDSKVIAYLFGEGVEPLAYVQIIPSLTVDTNAELAVDKFLLSTNAKIPIGETLERYNRAAAKDGAEVLTMQQAKPTSPALDPQGNPIATAGNQSPAVPTTSQTQDDVAAAVADYFAPLRKEIRAMLELPDEELAGAVTKLNEDLASYLTRRGIDPKTVEIVSAAMGKRMLQGLTGEPTQD
jgi:phage gp29-like protein